MVLCAALVNLVNRERPQARLTPVVQYPTTPGTCQAGRRESRLVVTGNLRCCTLLSGWETLALGAVCRHIS